jgi:hypothetical protein
MCFVVDLFTGDSSRTQTSIQSPRLSPPSVISSIFQTAPGNYDRTLQILGFMPSALGEESVRERTLLSRVYLQRLQRCCILLISFVSRTSRGGRSYQMSRSIAGCSVIRSHFRMNCACDQMPVSWWICVLRLRSFNLMALLLVM